MKVKQSRQELISHLREQMDFVRASAQGFDAGNEAEAKRLATTLRVLLHNSKQSHSLLKQVGVQHQLRFLDTSEIPEKASGPGILLYRWDAGLGAVQMDENGARFIAPLSDDHKKIRGLQPFRMWWNQPILEDMHRERFTRKEIVLFMANQAGGAHVDPEIQHRFVALTRLNSLGWGQSRDEEGHPYITVPAGLGEEPMGNPIPVNIRQITFEVERTVLEQLGPLLGGAPSPALQEQG
jgi:hypothetical protein